MSVLERAPAGQGFDQCCFVIFDGLHYDPLEMVPARAAGSATSPTITTFNSNDTLVFDAAVEFVNEQKHQRQFTDTAGFTLRCITCNTPLTGQAEAQAHAKATGHTNFGEV